MKKIIWAAVLLACSVSVQAETMTNDGVLSLVKQGLGDELLVAKINSEPCNYDTSISSVIALKNAGVSERILAAMVSRCASINASRGIAGDDASTDPLVRHSPGIYLVQDWQKPSGLTHLVAAKSSGMKTSGNGSIIFPLVAKMLLPGETSARTVLSTSPTFYFYFDKNDAAVSDFGQQHSEAVNSPDAFSLVRLKPKKGNRELEMGRMSAFGSSIVGFRKGLSLKSAVPFTSTEQKGGIFEARTGPLEPGEYAFVFTGGDEASRIYDFTIAPPASAGSR